VRLTQSPGLASYRFGDPDTVMDDAAALSAGG
jgi:hypothetical protein